MTKRLASTLLWTSLFLVLLAGMDQFFVRVPTTAPVLAEARAFYLDFRGRLFSLAGGKPQDTLEAVIQRSDQRPAARSGGEEGTPSYLYVDSGGQLHFADSLREIPPKYRKEAQPLSD